jgi:hypothetical protein
VVVSQSADIAADARPAAPVAPITSPPPLEPLPEPVHFRMVTAAQLWTDVIDASPSDAAKLADADAYRDRIIENADCWAAQSYLRLRARGLDVTISRDYRADRLNVVSYHDLAAREFPVRYFLCATRQDNAHPFLADCSIVQNPMNVRTPGRDHYIPHWPQPGLIKRDPSRGSRIENIAFKGAKACLHESFGSPQFLAALTDMGVRMIFDVKNPVTGAPQWYDYREVDLVLAVRDATVKDMEVKPASKLVNAWLAGCPALLGPEPAFQKLRQSPLDFIEVKSTAEALAAIRKLLDEPETYEAMVRNGQQRAVEFTPDAVAKLWRDTLAGPVTEQYRRWRRTRLIWLPVRAAMFVPNYIRDRKARKIHKHNIRHGYRPISGVTT